MADPIFRPNEPNFSATALEHAQSLMDPTQVDTLKIERANLTQATHMAVFALGNTLGLSDITRDELSLKLAVRLQGMSPAYHDFINHLIGESAEAIEAQHKPAPVFIESRVSSSGTLDVSAEEQNDGIQSVQVEFTAAPANQISADNTMAPAAVGSGLESESDSPDGKTVEIDEGIPANEAEPVYMPTEEELDAPYVLPLPDDLLLYDLNAKNKNQLLVLTDIFPNLVTEIKALNPRELTLLTWVVVEFFKQHRIPRIGGEQKEEQSKRLELFLGLHAKPLSSKETGVRTYVTDASIVSSIKTVRKNLRILMEDVAEQALLCSIATARQPSTEKHFTTDHIERNYAPSSPNNRMKGIGKKWYSGEGVAGDGSSQRESSWDTDTNADNAVNVGTNVNENQHDDLLAKAEETITEQAAEHTEAEIDESEVDTISEAKQALLKGTDAIPLHPPRAKKSVGMRNFLYGVNQPQNASKTDQLSPMQAAVFARELVGRLRYRLENSGLREPETMHRVRFIERNIGLYSDAIDVDALAADMRLSPEQLRANLATAYKQVKETLSKASIVELLDAAGRLNAAELATQFSTE